MKFYLVLFVVYMFGCTAIGGKYDGSMMTKMELAKDGDKQAIHTVCYRFHYHIGTKIIPHKPCIGAKDPLMLV